MASPTLQPYTGAMPLETPENILRELPSHVDVTPHRERLRAIVQGEDKRFLLIAGPCSIFNKRGALEFAEKFKRLREEVKGTIELVLRAPPAKPRTVSKAGQWEGLVHEPHEVAKYEPNEGLRVSREILRDIVALDIPVAIELLDTKRTAYFEDLLSLTWTGARTIENSDLRRQSSGMPWPVGFKNRTDGAIKPAVDAIESASGENFYDATEYTNGKTEVRLSDGNMDSFLILRGGEKITRYSAADVEESTKLLRERGLCEFIIIDSAHGNSADEKGVRTFKRQSVVFRSTFDLWKAGARVGAMMEVYLKEGKQSVSAGAKLDDLAYDVSPTDDCVGWDEFEALIRDVQRKA